MFGSTFGRGKIDFRGVENNFDMFRCSRIELKLEFGAFASTFDF